MIWSSVMACLLSVSKENLPERSGRQVGSLGQKEDRVQRRTNDRAAASGPDACCGFEQGSARSLVGPHDQYPRLLRYLGGQVLEHFMAVGR